MKQKINDVINLSFKNPFICKFLVFKKNLLTLLNYSMLYTFICRKKKNEKREGKKRNKENENVPNPSEFNMHLKSCQRYLLFF